LFTVNWRVLRIVVTMAGSKGPPTVSPKRSSWVNALLRFVLPVPIVVALILRGVDALYFEPALNETGLGHELLLGFTLAAGLLLCALSIRRPSLAIALSAIAFGSLKQFADASLPMPDLGTPALALVTGANAGIGKAVAAELARQGHTVLMGCRSPKRCLAARADILASSPGVEPEQLILPGATAKAQTGEADSGLQAGTSEAATVEAQTTGRAEAGLPLDLSRLSSVAAWAAAAAAAAGERGGIGLVVLNAGFVPLGEAGDDGGQGANVVLNADSGWEEGLYAM
jgi:hypothetical protein